MSENARDNEDIHQKYSLLLLLICQSVEAIGLIFTFCNAVVKVERMSPLQICPHPLIPSPKWGYCIHKSLPCLLNLGLIPPSPP
jgi:hypothetical protein